jgi:UDP-glucose 4-epimerase
MKIAVTGASGGVGRAVVGLALAQGHSVVAIDRVPVPAMAQGVPLVHLDLSDYAALAQALAGCEALIHLAAINGPGRDPDHVVHNNNVVSSYNALRAATELRIPRVCQASSVNAIGGRFSRSPQYDYFPLDERHPAYVEDPYSLSKWICEQQADAIARRHDGIAIASLRLHGVVTDRAATRGWIGTPQRIAEKQLWGYTLSDAAARAFLLGVTADFAGHEVFYIVAPDTMVDTPSMKLRAQHYPEVPVRGDLSGNRGFFDCRKANEVLGWQHDAASLRSVDVYPSPEAMRRSEHGSWPES